MIEILLLFMRGKKKVKKEKIINFGWKLIKDR